jgi:hypothetical protein
MQTLSLTDFASQSARYYSILMLPGSAGVAHIVECFFSRWQGSGLPSIDVAQLGAVGLLGRQASPKQHCRWQRHAVIFPIRRSGTAFSFLWLHKALMTSSMLCSCGGFHRL